MWACASRTRSTFEQFWYGATIIRVARSAVHFMVNDLCSEYLHRSGPRIRHKWQKQSLMLLLRDQHLEQCTVLCCLQYTPYTFFDLWLHWYRQSMYGVSSWNSALGFQLGQTYFWKRCTKITVNEGRGYNYPKIKNKVKYYFEVLTIPI